jgi:tRNA(His) 5'-end guanylyltransferase
LTQFEHRASRLASFSAPLIRTASSSRVWMRLKEMKTIKFDTNIYYGLKSVGINGALR